MEYNLISHDHLRHIGTGPMKMKQQLRKDAATYIFKYSTQFSKGAILHYVNKGVEVEQNETSFDYQSSRYTVNKYERTYR